MRYIYYKKMFDKYEISDIREGEGSDITIKFEEAFDGILVVGGADFAVSHGVCCVRSERLCDGEQNPKLYTGCGCQSIEGFVFKSGAIIRMAPDSDYIRELAKELLELSERVSELEFANIETKKRITQRLEF